jgi:hypothetical protein
MNTLSLRITTLILGLTTLHLSLEAQAIQCGRMFGAYPRGMISDGIGQYGPKLIYRSSRTGELPKKFRIGSYNILNLFEHVPNQNQRDYNPIKERVRRLGNAKAIMENPPDIQILVEVENKRAAENFAERYLGGKYEALVIEGNDTRGIDLALLVNRELPVEIEWVSNKEFPGQRPNEKVFSPDLPMALVYPRGNRSRPIMAVLATHYKSKRTEPGSNDLEGQQKRALQVRATRTIVQKLANQYGPDFPVMLAGDFNNVVYQAREFRPLFGMGFRDPFDGLSPEQRGTHFYFHPNGPMEMNQLDAILVKSPRVRILDAQVIHDKDPQGNPYPPPRSYQERETRPSDHRAISIEVQIQ